MPRYIDADALKESLMETLDYAKAWKKESERIGDNEVQIFAERAIVDFTECILRLNNAPEINAVEVLRCKDCKFYDAENHNCLDEMAYARIWNESDFCSFGERKEE